MSRKQKRLIQGRDYRFDPDGLCVLTREYLLSIGTCCHNGCRYCPYGHGQVTGEIAPTSPDESDAPVVADTPVITSPPVPPAARLRGA